MGAPRSTDPLQKGNRSHNHEVSTGESINGGGDTKDKKREQKKITARLGIRIRGNTKVPITWKGRGIRI